MAISCKFCGSISYTKQGITRCSQRYKCQDCGRYYIEGDKRVVHNEKREMSLKMYTNGVGIRAIGRILSIPYQYVQLWIKKAGKDIEVIVSNNKNIEASRDINVLECDELYTYVKKKNRVLIWTAVDRDRGEIVACEVGGSSEDNFRWILHQISHHNIGIIATDANPVYASVLSEYPSIQHVVTKSETCLVESLNSSMRDMLARLNRKTKRFSKSIHMLRQHVFMWAFHKISKTIFI